MSVSNERNGGLRLHCKNKTLAQIRAFLTTVPIRDIKYVSFRKSKFNFPDVMELLSELPNTRGVSFRKCKWFGIEDLKKLSTFVKINIITIAECKSVIKALKDADTAASVKKAFERRPFNKAVNIRTDDSRILIQGTLPKQSFRF